MYCRFLTIIVLLSVIGLSDIAWPAGPSGFTQADRERLVRLEATLEMFMKATDRRFEELRQDMNKRFSELRQDMNKRFEQVDKRFEQVDKRFEQMMNFMWILASIFAAMTVANIGFAYWDRRTIIRKAVDESVARIERKGSLAQLINALQDCAKDDPKLTSILKNYGFL
jgi:DNA anti-recombination protein RmuC